MLTNCGPRLKMALLVFGLFCSVACQKAELYHDLTEEDANEILVLLLQNQIDAKKVREIHQNQMSWTIQLEPSKLGAARELMVRHNLPRPHIQTMEDVYKKPGLVPTPDEQKAKYLIGRKGDVTKLLYKSSDDVVSAEVVLNIPTEEEFGFDKEKKEPTASVAIKLRPTEQAMANFTEAKIQRIVANAVEGMDERNVAVVITYTSPPVQGISPGQTLILPSAVTRQDKPSVQAPTVSVAGVEVSAASSGKLKVYFGVFLGLLALLSLGLVATIFQAVRMRKENEVRAAAGPALPGPAAGEAPRLGPGT